MKIAIQNALILDPTRRGEVLCGSVAIAEGRIASVGHLPPGFVPDTTIEAHGALLIPALVDLRARVGMPTFSGKDTLTRELAIAARYGIGTVVCPPDTQPVLDEPGLVHMLKHSAGNDHARLLPLGALTRGLLGQDLASLHTLSQAGCVGFAQGDKGLGHKQVLLRAMQYAATHQATLWLAPLDSDLGSGVAASGPLSMRMGLEGIPVAAETLALYTIFELMRATQARVHLQGISSAAGVALLQQAKAEKLPVTADLSIHNLYLCDLDMGYFDSRTRLSPPLRSQRDRSALQEALADGTIDALTSDHTPVSQDGKAQPFSQAQIGARGLELLLSLALHGHSLDKPQALAQALSSVTCRPSAVLNSSSSTNYAPYSFVEGAVADLCLIDIDAENPVNRDTQFAALTPFAHELNGFALHGQVKATIIAGKISYRLQ